MSDETPSRAPEASAPASHHKRSPGPVVPVPVPAVPADGLPAALAVAASSFAARRCASSAPKRSTRFPTAMFVCCKGLWPSAARLCLAG